MGVSVWIIVALCLSTVSAISYTKRPALVAVAAKIKAKTEASSCFYQLNVGNYEGKGFQGKHINVTVDGVLVVSTTLLPYVMEKSAKVPVTEGQSISIQYGGGEVEAPSANFFWLSNADGANVLNVAVARTGNYPLAATATCACVYPTTCPSHRVRNEFRSMSYCEKKNFMEAMLQFHDVPTASANFTKFVMHHTFRSHDVIQRSLFLPWHRAFILEFENSLRAMGGKFSCLALPYWDWSLDFGHELDSPVIAELGGIAPEACLTGIFSSWMNPVNQQCVRRRSFVSQPFSPSVASTSAVELGVTGNSSYWYAFTYFVRNPHKSVHIFVGGSNGTMGSLASPADPLFWLHHANLDRIYAMWQDCWDYDQPGTERAQYRDISSGLAALDLPMPPHYPGRSSTVRAMVDIMALGYQYPPYRRELKRLNGANPIFGNSSSGMCKWDWFNPTTFKAAGLRYRPSMLSNESEYQLSQARTSFATELSRSGDYYQAKVAQLKSDCDIADGSYNDDYPEMFTGPADHTGIIGPSVYFKNACQLLRNGRLHEIFSH